VIKFHNVVSSTPYHERDWNAQVVIDTEHIGSCKSNLYSIQHYVIKFVSGEVYSIQHYVIKFVSGQVYSIQHYVIKFVSGVLSTSHH
jgi:hypothetical protein